MTGQVVTVSLGGTPRVRGVWHAATSVLEIRERWGERVDSLALFALELQIERALESRNAAITVRTFFADRSVEGDTIGGHLLETDDLGILIDHAATVELYDSVAAARLAANSPLRRSWESEITFGRLLVIVQSARRVPPRWAAWLGGVR